ncbi:Uncharacterized protein GBIM_05075 [Gryllus bimaculatus]|nr:Uncharacterized protein GBIM_05075 [Gryllus bimaculatus]
MGFDADDERHEATRVFKGCRKRSPTFDSCVMKGLNSIQHLFKRGIPELNVAPFDPHHALEVLQRRGGPSLNYRLRLIDVEEYGWSRSFVDRFKSDLDSNRIEYSQYFPEKWLKGEYEMDGLMLQYPMHNRGVWNITLYKTHGRFQYFSKNVFI